MRTYKQFCASVNCLHSHINILGVPSWVSRRLLADPVRLPFPVLLTETRVSEIKVYEYGEGQSKRETWRQFVSKQ